MRIKQNKILPKVLLYFLEIDIMVKSRWINYTNTTTRTVYSILTVVFRLNNYNNNYNVLRKWNIIHT